MLQVARELNAFSKYAPNFRKLKLEVQISLKPVLLGNLKKEETEGSVEYLYIYINRRFDQSGYKRRQRKDPQDFTCNNMDPNIPKRIALPRRRPKRIVFC